MFDKNKPRYLTRGVNTEIPLEIQLFLWDCVDRLPAERDYLQVFKLKAVGGVQHIIHTSEQPNFRKEYRFPTARAIEHKVYIIDDGEHCTMLLAEEY